MDIRRRYQKFKYWSNWLQCWDWEWIATFTFPAEWQINEYDAKIPLKKWTRSLVNHEQIQVGYFSVLCYKHGHPHFHLLMIGRNRDNKTLLDVDCARWVREWRFVARIEPVRSLEDVSHYLAEQNFWKKCSRSYFDSYNTYLLTRCRRQDWQQRMGIR